MIFLKHKRYLDVCILAYNIQSDGSTYTIYGEFWNLGVNKSHRTGATVIQEVNPFSLRRDWQYTIDNTMCLRQANWQDVNLGEINNYVEYETR
jgi:hypothetical protein